MTHKASQITAAAVLLMVCPPAIGQTRPVSLLTGTEELEPLDGISYQIAKAAGSDVFTGITTSYGQTPFHNLVVQSDYVVTFPETAAYDGICLGIEDLIHIPDSPFIPNESHYYGQGFVQPHLRSFVMNNGLDDSSHHEFNRNWMAPEVHGSKFTFSAHADLIHCELDVRRVMNYLQVPCPTGVELAWVMKAPKDIELGDPGMALCFFDDHDRVVRFGGMDIRAFALTEAGATSGLELFSIEPPNAPRPAQIAALTGTIPKGYLLLLMGENLDGGVDQGGAVQVPVEYLPLIARTTIVVGPTAAGHNGETPITPGGDPCTCKSNCPLEPSDIGAIANDACYIEPWNPDRWCPLDGTPMGNQYCWSPKMKFVGPIQCSNGHGGPAPYTFTLSAAVTLSWGFEIPGLTGGASVELAAGATNTINLGDGAFNCGQCAKPVAAAVICSQRFEDWFPGLVLYYKDHWLFGPNTPNYDWELCAQSFPFTKRCFDGLMKYTNPCDIGCL